VGTVTPYAIQGEGYVRVEVDWRDFPHARKCWIYRRLEPSTSPLTMLRDGNSTRLSGGIAVAFDHEAPLDVPVMYRSVIALNYNGDFSEGVSEWLDTANQGTIGTVTQSFDYYVAGESNASLRLEPSGAATSRAVSEFIPVTAGQSYTVTGRLMVPDYWSGGIGVQIHWYNGTTYLSTVGAANDFAPFPGNWDRYGFSATAPATTTNARIMATIDGTAPASLPLYAGEMYLTTTGTSVNAALPVVLQSSGGGWWTDPLHPWTKVRLQVELENSSALCGGPSGVVYLGLSEKSFPADSTTLEVNDSPYGVGAFNVRKAARSSIRIGTRTLLDEAKVKLLHASGAPLFFHMNGAYGETDFYGLYGDVAEGRVHGDQRVTWRLFGIAYAEQAAPVGPAEGTLGSRYMDFTKYATFGAAFAAGGGVLDDFGRTVAAGGWGAPTIGAGSWNVVGTAANYSVSGGVGLMSMASLAVLRRAQLLSVSVASFDAVVTNTISAALTGGGAQGDFTMRMRYVDDNNYVDILIFRSTTAVTMAIRQRVGGVDTISSFPAVAGATSASSITMRLVGTGTSLFGTAWVTGTVEPQAPMVTLTGLTHLAAGGIELNGNLNASVTNALPLTAGYDDLQVANLANNGAATWLDGLQGELVA
jgi:hypothetical protein